jgi:NAD(P)-dependent dehydrogenase (short-subunit alcohol dehydrogenase family)
MRVFVTGGTGFIGGHVVRLLRERGDDVRALIRDPDKGGPLTDLGCELVSGTLANRDAIRAGMEGCDAAIHGAAMYEVGIPKSEHRTMYEANVIGTENVLGAALEAKLPKVVYVSTVGAFGNTKGQVVDESYEHPGDGLHLLLRGDQGRGPPPGQAPDRGRGPTVRDRPARWRLRARRLVGAGSPDEPVPGREDAPAGLSRARVQPGSRG